MYVVILPVNPLEDKFLIMINFNKITLESCYKEKKNHIQKNIMTKIYRSIKLTRI